MAVLARDSPYKTRLGLGAWLRQLLFFAADAAAGGDWQLAARALDAFAAAVSRPGSWRRGCCPICACLGCAPRHADERSVLG